MLEANNYLLPRLFTFVSLFACLLSFVDCYDYYDGCYEFIHFFFLLPATGNSFFPLFIPLLFSWFHSFSHSRAPFHKGRPGHSPELGASDVGTAEGPDAQNHYPTQIQMRAEL